jgi:hypothetical protein
MLALCAAACLLSTGCPPPDGNGDGNGNGMMGETRTFNATLSGDQEVPPVTTDATGSGTFTVDTGTGMLEFEVTFSGLSGGAIGAHLHNGQPGENAPVSEDMTAPFAGMTSGTVMGTATLDQNQIADMVSGNMYFNIHTPANMGGEIRGQLEEAP